jgi:polyisoprenoid-binding protein YceI
LPWWRRLSAVPVRAEMWKIDPAHSRAHFAVRHMMVTTVRGDFGGVEGTIEYDGKDVKTLKIDASVDVGPSTRWSPSAMRTCAAPTSSIPGSSPR